MTGGEDRLARRRAPRRVGHDGGPMRAVKAEAARKRRYRAGVRVLRVPVRLVEWSETLVDAGWLAAWDADNLAAITEATARFIEATTPALIVPHVTNRGGR